MGKFDVKSSVTDGGSRQWKQTEQLKTIVAPIGVRLILGKLVLHSYSPMQNQMVRENGRGFRSEDRRENCCMMRKAAAPEIAVLDNLAEQNGRRLDSEERTVKLNNQPALVAPVPSS